MSTETTAAPALEYQIDNDVLTGEKYITNGNHRVYLKEYGGALKGIQFHVPQFVASVVFNKDASDEDKAKAHASAAEEISKANEKYGAAVVLDMVNDSLHYGVRAKVKAAKIPKFDDDASTKAAIANLVANSPVVFSVEDAENYVPGARTISYAGYCNLAKQAQRDGNRELAFAYLEKAMAALALESAAAGE